MSVMKKFVRDEAGFTLSEALVAMVLMVTVMFALYSIFDMSIRVFSFGNDKIEAVENARVGMEKMKREIRAAYPYNKLTGTDETLFPNFTSSTSNQITFGNDLDGDRTIDAATNEQITYKVSGTTLQRNNTQAVEFVEDVDGDGSALTFEFLKQDGSGNLVAASTEDEVDVVRMKLEVAVDRGLQEEPVTETLQTDVALRNRVG